ncbi:hypothetical protein RN001_014779 [Aquatica leii]|uniref:Regulatory protein zeste n=1 Tax=Aquatica leii TaxID=1421715 RepID=A0AAN7PYT3_9COLE|nr:hypothetical protein RN001_014779 [Aquatica leii]
MNSDKKVREPNFSSSEKMHLMNIIANKYALILEDKKTDRASTSEKLKAWQVVEEEFNASSTSTTYRDATCLKKCYENRKKELRKSIAQERREILLTGGGPPAKIKRDDTDDVLMSILNKKTLVGLNNRFDDDADQSLIAIINEPVQDAVFEYAYESDEGEKREPLSKNVTPAERQNNSQITLKRPDNCIPSASKDWNKYTPTEFQTPINPALGFTESVSEKDVSKDDKTPKKSISRRRPTTIVKSMTSSDIAKKYDLLLDKRLQLIDIELAHVQARNALITKKLNLEIQLLENQLSK